MFCIVMIFFSGKSKGSELIDNLMQFSKVKLRINFYCLIYLNHIFHFKCSKQIINKPSILCILMMFFFGKSERSELN